MKRIVTLLSLVFVIVFSMPVHLFAQSTGGTVHGVVSKIPVALIPKAGEFGTLGRNTYTGPAYKNVDVSLIKNTRLSEGLRMQIRGELFNVFNTTNLALPLRTLTDPYFGLSRKTQDVAGGVPGIGGGGPRVMQLAVKLTY